MNGGTVRKGVFSVTGSNAAPSLQNFEDIFNDMPVSINEAVIFPLYNTIFLGRYDYLNPIVDSFINNIIGVIGFVRKQCLVFNALG